MQATSPGPVKIPRLLLQLPSNALGHVLQHSNAARDQLQLLILLFHDQLVPEKWEISN